MEKRSKRIREKKKMWVQVIGFSSNLASPFLFFFLSCYQNNHNDLIDLPFPPLPLKPNIVMSFRVFQYWAFYSCRDKHTFSLLKETVTNKV